MSRSCQRYCRYGGAKLEKILKKREERRQKTCLDVSIIHNSDGFDECLFYEILSWLPAKSLLRFKSVCKSWYTIIKSRSFISKHLNQQYSNRINDDCFIAMCKTGTHELESIQIILSDRHNVVTYAKFDDKPEFDHDFCGPCGGLYYVWSRYGMDNDRCLWNPTLREYKKLPPIAIEPNNLPSNVVPHSWEYCGLGFDPVTQDYKVVIIKTFTKKGDVFLSVLESIPPRILVYSLRTNSWRHAADLPKFYYWSFHQSYVFANTSLYWLASKDQYYNIRNEAIIVFDLATDECRDIQLPGRQTKISIRRHFCEFECLMVYNGDMAYVTNFTLDQFRNCFDVWTLKEECWAKKLTIRLDLEVQKPLGQWRDGLLVFKSRYGTTFLCNLDTHEAWELSGRLPLDYDGFLCAYQESLVSLHHVTV